MRKNLDEIMLDMSAVHCHIPDKPALYKWLFEYAVCALEYQGLNPSKHPAELDWLIRFKATQMYDVAKDYYWSKKSNYILLQLYPLEAIPEIVKSEYQKLKTLK